MLCVAGLAGQGGGLRPVTPADAAQAIESGRSNGPIGYAPLLDRLTALRHAQQPTSYPGPNDLETMRQLLHTAPFVFSIDSPYTRIAGLVRGCPYTFPFAVFDPSSDITVVIVGTKGNFEWTIARDELAAMR